MTVPQITLNDETTIPQLGLGVWQVPQDDAERVVSEALEVGYRHIDTAQMYGNEAGVGAAIRASSLPREEVYVTTKLNNNNHAPTDVLDSLQRSLELLQLERVDLFLIHWPLPTEYDGTYPATWEALIEAREKGLTTSIGVSNFQPAHLQRIVTETGVTPAVNQIEIHPYFTNSAAREASLSLGAKVEAWSPLGQGGGELEDEVIAGIAKEHGKTPAQVLLRWQLDRGDIVFPKSTRRERLVENFDVLDFALTPDEVDRIAGLDRGEDGRTGPNPDQFAWIPPKA